MSIHEFTAKELAAGVKEKCISLEDLKVAVFQSCDAVQKKLNAFINLNSNLIATEVDRVSGKLQYTEDMPLSGVPFAVADNICTAGIKTTCASRMMASYCPCLEAVAVQRLREKGAILVGKTNIDEFDLNTAGVGSFFGAVKNPWDQRHTAGSGAASAVACGVVNFALGQDRCGELRQSAAYCGALGLKPTYGRVSRRGLIEFSPSLEQIGIIAMKTTDLATALEIISGNDPLDPTSVNVEVPAYTSMLQEINRPIKVAVPEDWSLIYSLEKEIIELFKATLHDMEESIFDIKIVNLPFSRQASVAAAIISAVESFSNLSNYDGVRFGFRKDGKNLQDMYRQTRTEGFGSALKQFLVFGAMISSGKYYREYFLKAQKMRTLIGQEMDQCLKDYDVIAVPTTPFRAPTRDVLKEGHPLPDPAASYTAAANLAGLPALTFPVRIPNITSGINTAGLQFIAKAWDEIMLLRTALILEQMEPIVFAQI